MAVVVVREASHLGPCHLLGALVGETSCRYFYRVRQGTAFVDKRSPSNSSPPMQGLPGLLGGWFSAAPGSRARRGPPE